ncbi:MAG: adenylate kinase [Spirochaetes bacterium]|nr:adenylate kinase [Spirochaetota bacterium]
MRIIMLGAPGVGKGTISSELTKLYNIPQISTGDILRSEVSKGSEIGKKAESFMKGGGLVPDDIIMECVESRLSEDDCTNGFILDGFPRTIAQAELLKTLLHRKSLSLNAIINLEAPEDLIMRRLTSRRTCSNPSCQAIFNIYTKPPKRDGVCDFCESPLVQREDEKEEVIMHRLRVYKENTLPLIEYYKNEPIFFSIPCIDPKETVDGIRRRLDS